MKIIKFKSRMLLFFSGVILLPSMLSCGSEENPAIDNAVKISAPIIIIDSTIPSGDLQNYLENQEISVTTNYEANCTYQNVTLVENDEIHTFEGGKKQLHKIEIAVFPENEYNYKIVCTSDVNSKSYEEVQNITFITPASETDELTITKAYIPVPENDRLLILGYNFDVYDTTKLLIHDDFENGTDSNALLGGWTLYRNNNKGPFYTSEESYSGSLSVKNTIYYNSETSFNTAWKEFNASDEVYFSYRFMFKLKTESNKGVMKLARLTSDYKGENNEVSHYNGAGDTTLQYQPSSKESGWLYTTYNIGGNAIQDTIPSENFIHNQWNRIEIYKKLSSTFSVDGEYMVKVNNTTLLDKKDVLTRASGFDFKQSSVLLPLMYANPNEESEVTMYVDDIYISANFSRFELANCPNYNECTIREIQKVISWRDNEIKIELISEQLSKYADVYLFFIDQDGVASEGHLIER